jgi:hypothetical protein
MTSTPPEAIGSTIQALTYLDTLKLSADELLDDVSKKLDEGYYESGGVDATPDIIALFWALLQATEK